MKTKTQKFFICASLAMFYSLNVQAGGFYENLLRCTSSLMDKSSGPDYPWGDDSLRVPIEGSKDYYLYQPDKALHCKVSEAKAGADGKVFTPPTCTAVSPFKDPKPRAALLAAAKNRIVSSLKYFQKMKKEQPSFSPEPFIEAMKVCRKDLDLFPVADWAQKKFESYQGTSKEADKAFFRNESKKGG